MRFFEMVSAHENIRDIYVETVNSRNESTLMVPINGSNMNWRTSFLSTIWLSNKQITKISMQQIHSLIHNSAHPFLFSWFCRWNRSATKNSVAYFMYNSLWHLVSNAYWTRVPNITKTEHECVNRGFSVVVCWQTF